jgi:manganese-dependent inorganic pyrophosphatase
MISVFGHKAPDSDSILSAIILSDFFGKRGEKATPYVLGKISGEAKYILEKYGVAVPKLLSSLDEIADTAIALVDTTDPHQLPDGVDKMPVRMIIDHHPLGGLAAVNACEIWTRACGATCSVLYELFKYYKTEISKTTSTLILCGILADTLCLMSATTTDADRAIVKKLAKQLQADIPTLWNELLTAKSDIANLSDEELIMQDAKEFAFNEKKFIICNIEINDSAAVLPRLKTIKEKMREIKRDKNCWAVLLLIMDIAKEKTLFAAFTDDNEKIENLFDVKFVDNETVINKMVSRKKDIIPVLQSGF